MNNNIKNLIINKEFKQLSKYIELGIIKMEDALNEVIHLQNPKYIWDFAYFVKDAPIEKLALAAIETQNAAYIYLFASYMQKLNGMPLKKSLLDKFSKAIIAIHDARYIYTFACDIKEAPIKELAEAIIATGDAGYIYPFARDIKGAPMQELKKAIINMKDAEYMYLFSTQLIKRPSKEFAFAIANTKNAEYIYFYALYMQKENNNLFKNEFLEKFSHAIIATGNADYIYRFARDIKEAPIKELAKAEIATKNAEYIYLFTGVEGAPVKELIQGLVATRDIDYLNELIRKSSLMYTDFINMQVGNAILATDDAAFIYECVDKIIGIPVSIFICKIVEMKNFEIIADILKSVKVRHYPEVATKKENSIFNCVPMLIDAMKDCQDINLLKSISCYSEISQLISKLEAKMKAEIDVSLLSEEEKLNYLVKLYRQNDFETIRENKGVFQSLFQDRDEEITRK